jgi:hypothetical protein
MSETKNCQNCKKDFSIDDADLDFYKKIDVPPPTWCPQCRMQRRMSWRNERNLYKRTDDRTGQKVFSWLSDTAPAKVWEYKDWITDLHDPIKYGKEIDWSRPFLVQLGELIREVPWLSRPGLNLINSDYSMNAGNLKNCYLVLHADYVEDSMYCGHVQHCKGSCDVSYGEYADDCYNSIFLTKCYRTNFSVNCDNCVNVWFSKNCSNCQDCFGCVDLKSKQYHIFNQPYSKEQYEQEIKKYDLRSYRGLSEIEQQVTDFWRTYPVKYMTGYFNTNVSGDYISNSKNVHNSFDCLGAEDCRYCTMITPGGAKDCYDFNSYAESSELLYECNQVGLNCRLVKFCTSSWTSLSEVEYSVLCNSSSNLFGCMGVRNKQYCILNREYSKEEYEALVPKIKAHMNEMPYKDKAGRLYPYGEFLPAELSPFFYNETNAYEYFPLTKEQATAAGYSWKDSESREYAIDIPAAQLPDRFDPSDVSLKTKVIGCEHEGKCQHQCSTAFKLTQPEWDLYGRIGVALPRLCHNCRHAKRLEHRNPLKLWQRQCTCDYLVFQNSVKHQHHPEGRCSNQFQTSYAPERPEIVYCEQCYQAEVS